MGKETKGRHKSIVLNVRLWTFTLIGLTQRSPILCCKLACKRLMRVAGFNAAFFGAKLKTVKLLILPLRARRE